MSTIRDLTIAIGEIFTEIWEDLVDEFEYALDVYFELCFAVGDVVGKIVDEIAVMDSADIQVLYWLTYFSIHIFWIFDTLVES
jgi:hypothetical protein